MEPRTPNRHISQARTASIGQEASDSLYQINEAVYCGNASVADMLKLVQSSTEKVEQALEGIVKNDSFNKISLAAQASNEYLKNCADLLSAIAGNLFGDKTVTRNSDPKSLLGKLKKEDEEAPVTGSKISASKAASVFDTIFNPASRKNESSTIDGISSGSRDASATLRVLIGGIDGQGIESLYKLVTVLTEEFGSDTARHMKAFYSAIGVLNDTVNAVGSIDFKPINMRLIKKMELLNLAARMYKDIGLQMSSMSMIADFLSGSEASLMRTPKMIAEFIAGKNGKGGLVLVQDRFEKLDEGSFDLNQIRKEFGNIEALLKSVLSISIMGSLLGRSDKAFTRSKAAIENALDMVEGLKARSLADSAAKLEGVSSYVDTLSGVFKTLIMAAGFGVIASKASGIVRKGGESTVDMVAGVQDRIDKAKVNAPSKRQMIAAFTTMIFAISAVLVLAALIGGMLFKKFSNIMHFALVFTVFMSAMMVPFVIFTAADKALSTFIFKGNKGAASASGLLGAASQMGFLIATCAGVMLIGSLFMNGNMWVKSLEFTVVFSAFMRAMIMPLIGYALVMRIVGEGSSGLWKLLVAATGVMIVGALFMKTDLWPKALGFTLVMMAFITGVIAPFALAAYLLKSGSFIGEGVKHLGKMVVAFTAVMLVGAIMMRAKLADDALLFTVVMAAFVLAVVGVSALASLGDTDRQYKAMGAIAATVFAMTITMLIGAKFIEKNGAESALIYAAICAGFTALMVGITLLISNQKAKIIAGAAAAGAVALAVAIMGASMWIVGDAMAKFGTPLAALAMMGVFALSMTALFGLILGAGVILTGPLAIPFLAGVGAALTLSAAIAALGGSMLVIAKVMEKAESLNVEGAIAGLRTMLREFIGLVSEFRLKDAAAVMRAIPAIALMSTVASDVEYVASTMGRTVKNLSDMTITEYDSNGREIGKRHLTSTDFVNARDNLILLTTAVFSTFDGIRMSHPGLFSRKPEKNPIYKAAQVCVECSNTVRSIADTVKAYSELKFPMYDESGKLLGYTSIYSGDFGKMKENIKTVVTAISGAILAAYNTPSFKAGKVKRASKAIFKASEAVIEAAQAISLFSKDELRMTVNGSQYSIKYADIDDKLRTNIATVVCAIPKALFEAYSKSAGGKKKYFDPSWDGYKDIRRSYKKVDRILEWAVRCTNKYAKMDESIKDIDASKFGSSWAGLIDGLLAPFSDDKKFKENKKAIHRLSKVKLEKYGEFVKEVNKLDGSKIDKTNALMQSMLRLNDSMGNMTEFVQALNGKITNTLAELSDRIEEATDTLHRSEETQIKRQAFIERNNAELKKIMSTPMTINVAGGSGASSSVLSASSPEGGSNDTPNSASPVDTSASSAENFAKALDEVAILKQILAAIEGK